jgi:peptidoglycan/xylan/chitin deacetylase (PgdA/CDA1 family)
LWHLGCDSVRQNSLRLTTSWDDGHPLDFRIAEMLERYGLAGTFYVPRQAETEVMSTAQVQELSKHFEIGAHTLDHVRLHDIPEAEARRQMSSSRAWVEEITGKPCEVFCFPGGKFRRNQLPLVRECGFVAARTVEMMSLAGPKTRQGVALLATTIQAHPHSLLTYMRNVVRRWQTKNLWLLRFHHGAKHWASTAIALLNCARREGGVFHLWGHSWEIEETGQWGALERVLAAMGECKQEARCLTNGELSQNGGPGCQ